MSRSQFRLLLAAYLLVIAVGVVTIFVTESMIPESVARAQIHPFNAGPHGLSTATVAVRTAAGVMLLGTFVGLVGMFYFWRPGLYLFFAAMILRILMSPILWSWHAETGWNMSIGEIEIILEGVIFALAFFGPAKPLFRDSEESELRPISTDPTRNPVTLYDLVGQWQLYLDSASRTVSVDFRDDGTFVQRIIANQGGIQECPGGTWSLEGTLVHLTGYVTVGDGTSQSCSWRMIDTPSGLALFGGDGPDVKSFVWTRPGRPITSDYPCQVPVAGPASVERNPLPSFVTGLVGLAMGAGFYWVLCGFLVVAFFVAAPGIPTPRERAFMIGAAVLYSIPLLLWIVLRRSLYQLSTPVLWILAIACWLLIPLSGTIMIANLGM